MLWKEKENKPKEIRGCSPQCFHQPVQRTSQIYQCPCLCVGSWLGSLSSSAPPRQHLELLWEAFVLLLQLKQQQGWLNEVERAPCPCSPAHAAEGRNALWDSQPKGMDRDVSGGVLPNNKGAMQIAFTWPWGLNTPVNSYSLVSQKIKSPHSRIYSHYHFWSSVHNSLWERVIATDDCEEVPVSGSFIPLWHRDSPIVHTHLFPREKNISKPQKLHFWSCG